MKFSIEIANRSFQADLLNPIDISIPVGKQDEVKAYGIPDSSIEIYRDGGFVGDVAAGGSCNVRDIKFNPHGNGTHTECVGHVSKDYVTTYEVMDRFLFTATLLTVGPGESVTTDDLDILDNAPLTETLIIRTLPNEPEKLSKDYTGKNATYIHPSAMRKIVDMGYIHLLVDLPSVDHESDPELQSHKIFWEIDENKKSKKTITELIYVASDILDGTYLLNLMVPSMYSDAVPSKPILYTLR